MVIGHGKGFSTILLSEDQEQIESCGYTADYHVAQFLATRRALAERRRPVVAILMKDLGAGSRAELGAFFAAATRRLGKG